MKDRRWILPLVAVIGFSGALALDLPLRGLADRLEARQTSTAVTLTGPRVICSDATMETDVSTRPAGTGWIYGVRVNGGRERQTSSTPYRITIKDPGGPGQYVLTSRWVRGTEERKLDQKTVLCHAATVTTQPVVTAPPPPPPPPVVVTVPTFTADPSLVTSAAVATVRLHFPGITGATSVSIDNGVGTVTGASFKDVTTPPITTFYTLTAQPGDVKKQVTVTVNIPSPPPPPPPTEICGDKIDNDKDGQVDEGCPTTPPPPSPVEICGNGEDDDFDGQTDEDPPCTVQTTKKIWGFVSPEELGVEWTVAEHDEYIVDGGDGFWYRTWHPQCKVLRGLRRCTAHEHGDDPSSQQQPWVRANWDGRMGYAARRDTTHADQPNGHEEPHNGYKVHVVNIGDVNNEGRVNQTATTSMPHMGTGGPARFSVDRHSVSITDWHQNGIHHSAIHAMFSTGTRGNPVVDNTISSNCPVRTAAPTKDGLIIGQCAPQDSSYEIWGMLFRALRNGVEIFRKFVNPAVFDPVTVHDPSRPSTTVYAWDPIVSPFKKFQNDWSNFRGCDREGYSQVGYHYNGNDPSEEYLIDVRTNTVVTTASAWTTRLVVGRSNTGGNPPFSSNILQFKMRRSHCQDRNKLGLKN